MTNKVRISFDETSPLWVDGDPERNIFFIEATEKYLDDRLQTKGHLVLNEVFSALGVDETPEGAICGWSLAKANTAKVEFEIYPRWYGAVDISIVTMGDIHSYIGKPRL